MIHAFIVSLNIDLTAVTRWIGSKSRDGIVLKRGKQTRNGNRKRKSTREEINLKTQQILFKINEYDGGVTWRRCSGDFPLSRVIQTSITKISRALILARRIKSRFKSANWKENSKKGLWISGYQRKESTKPPTAWERSSKNKRNPQTRSGNSRAMNHERRGNRMELRGGTVITVLNETYPYRGEAEKRCK